MADDARVRRSRATSKSRFDEPENDHVRIGDRAIGLDATIILVMRGVGPIGYLGLAEVAKILEGADASQRIGTACALPS